MVYHFRQQKPTLGKGEIRTTRSSALGLGVLLPTRNDDEPENVFLHSALAKLVPSKHRWGDVLLLPLVKPDLPTLSQDHINYLSYMKYLIEVVLEAKTSVDFVALKQRLHSVVTEAVKPPSFNPIPTTTPTVWIKPSSTWSTIDSLLTTTAQESAVQTQSQPQPETQEQQGQKRLGQVQEQVYVGNKQIKVAKEVGDSAWINDIDLEPLFPELEVLNPMEELTSLTAAAESVITGHFDQVHNLPTNTNLLTPIAQSSKQGLRAVEAALSSSTPLLVKVLTRAQKTKNRKKKSPKKHAKNSEYSSTITDAAISSDTGTFSDADVTIVDEYTGDPDWFPN